MKFHASIRLAKRKTPCLAEFQNFQTNSHFKKFFFSSVGMPPVDVNLVTYYASPVLIYMPLSVLFCSFNTFSVIFLMAIVFETFKNLVIHYLIQEAPSFHRFLNLFFFYQLQWVFYRELCV